MNSRIATTLACFLIAAPLSTEAQAQSKKPQVITNSIGMKLAKIPAGTFMMGAPRSEAERTKKELQHKVTISKSFFIGVYEVKQSEYSEVMRGVPKVQNRSSFKGPNRPAENVEWKLAKIFCRQLSAKPGEKSAGRKYRLPTEAEWEYACRGVTNTAFHVGKSLSASQANFNGKYPAGRGKKGKYLRRTVKVGSYKPNAFGLYDTHGNVAEWCGDWYDSKYYFNSPDKDPLGPPFGVVDTKFTNNGDENFFVVVRGGCWLDDARACRAAYRYRAMPNTRYRLIGFRVVCE